MAKDLVGKTLGMLTVLCRSDSKNPSHKNRRAYLCFCECGKKRIMSSKSLLRGNPAAKSCGCQNSHTDPKAPRLSSARLVYRHHKYNDGNLSFNDFLTLSQEPCYYCGVESSNSVNIHRRRRNQGKSVSDFAIKHGTFDYNGLDRKENSKPHNKNNVVTCCSTCNWSKGPMSLKQFRNWVKRVYLKLNSSMPF